MTSFEPHHLPVDSIAGEAALDPERMTSSWLRSRFANPTPWVPEYTEEQLQRQAGRSLRKAAVLMPIVIRPEGLTLLFTLRNADLTDHAGQISFPGGRIESYDMTPVDTALRETEEEVGLARQHIEPIGVLPDYFTGTGYCVTPVAALVQPPFELRPDPREVAEVFEVPLAFLMDGMNHQRRTLKLPDGFSQRSFYVMPYDRFFIWGATAGMLRNLFHFLRS